jgi:hypothetical protein
MAKALRVTPKTAAPGIPTDETIRRLIAEAAYYRAEQRGFAPGGETEDWLQAEEEVRTRLEGTA